jgi:hypothetical protein
MRCATPFDRRSATARERAITRVKSTRSSPTSSPNSFASAIAWRSSAVRSSALVGMQPQLRQIPPSASRSTSAVLSPSWRARIAAT